MRINRDLRSMQRTAVGRLRRLRDVAVACSSPTAAPRDRELGVTYSVVELYNLWYGFSRSLYLSAAFGARDGTGSRVALTVTPRPRTVEEALTHAIRLRPSHKTRNPPWRWQDEPSWARTKILLDSLAAIGASNGVQVSAALSSTSRVFDELEPFRHFFAHRGRDTRQRLPPVVRAHSIPVTLRPTEALLTPATVLGVLRPQPLLLDWIDDVNDVVNQAV